MSMERTAISSLLEKSTGTVCCYLCLYWSLSVFIKRKLDEFTVIIVIVLNTGRFIWFIISYLFQNGFHFLLHRINGSLNECDLYT